MMTVRALLIVAVAPLCVVASGGVAQAYLYWPQGDISTANLDGTNYQTVNGDQAAVFEEIGALASDGSHLYFASGDDVAPSIDRIDPDGSGLATLVAQVPSPACTNPSISPDLTAVAIAGSHVYWADASAGTIGSVNIDGSDPNPDLVQTAGGFCGTVDSGSRGPGGVAADGSHLFWTNPDQDTIAEANLDGSAPDQTLITGALDPLTIAVDGSDLYWLNADDGDHMTGWIGHAQLDASGAVLPRSVDQQFIGPLTTYGDGLGLTTYGDSVYFDNGDGWIGHAALDGSGLVRHLVNELPAGTDGPTSIGSLAADGQTADLTTTSVRCAPSALQLLTGSSGGAVNDSATCTATVTDTGMSPSKPAGSVTFTETPPEGDLSGDLGANGQDGGGAAPACALAASGLPGQSSCAVTFQTDNTIYGYVRHAASTVIGATYGGETTHDGSAGSTTVGLEQVRPCDVVDTQDGGSDLKVCGSVGGWGAHQDGSAHSRWVGQRGYGAVTGTSCPTTKLCVVSSVDALRVSTHPTGGQRAWHVVRPAGTGELTDVSCPTASLCVATDDHGDVITSTAPEGGAGAWTRRNVDGGDALDLVSCPSTSLCVALDASGDVLTSAHPAQGASSWTFAATNLDGDTSISGLSCPSAQLCVAVDGAGDVLTTPDPTGSTGSWSQSNLGAGAVLDAVSCPESTFCVASGAGSQPGAGGGPGLVAWSEDPTGGASAWHTTTFPFSTTDRWPGVSCVSASMCALAGDGPILANTTNPTGDASHWGLFSPPGCPGQCWYGMDSVSCASATLCVAGDSIGDLYVGPQAPSSPSTPGKSKSGSGTASRPSRQTNSITITIRCPQGTSGRCRLLVRLTTRVTARHHTSLVTIGAQHASIPARRRARITITLNSSGRRLLGNGRAALRATLTVTDTSAHDRQITR